ncbi:MAG: Fic family protein [Armatimonadota bacterium]
MVAYHWTPINDLSADWPTLVSSELNGLISVWKEQQNRLEKLEGVKIFNQRLQREWSIETGIIENLYSIDRGTTALLIDKGLEASLIVHGATDKPAEQVIAILHDQQDALEGLFDFISQRRKLSTAYIKELHAALTRHQTTVMGINGSGRRQEFEMLRGEYKKWPNNPTRSQDEFLHEYCPPEHVAAEMDRLVAMHLEHVKMNVSPEVEAAWLHHRFTQIHPFQDGNGRMARILASLVFLRGHCFPLLIHRDLRDRYIAACEQADIGDLRPMVQLFAEVQKKIFVKVLSISEDVLHDREPLRQMLTAVEERLRAKQVATAQAKRAVFDIVKELEFITKERLQEATEQLTLTLQKTDKEYHAFVDASSALNDFWFKSQIITVAKQLQYYADTGIYRTWVRMKIKETRQVDIVISFHSLGYEFSGVLAASAFIEYRQRNEDGDVSVEGPYKLCEEVFQFAYTESRETVLERFTDWLNNVILSGFDQWRRSL